MLGKHCFSQHVQLESSESCAMASTTCTWELLLPQLPKSLCLACQYVSAAPGVPQPHQVRTINEVKSEKKKFWRSCHFCCFGFNKVFWIQNRYNCSQTEVPQFLTFNSGSTSIRFTAINLLSVNYCAEHAFIRPDHYIALPLFVFSQYGATQIVALKHSSIKFYSWSICIFER